MMLNPYSPPSAELNSEYQRLRFPFAMGHPLVTVLSLAVWIPLAIGWFYLAHQIDPFHEIDIPFFFQLYIAIGGMFGLLSWYCARIVSLGHVRIRTIALILILPFSFLLFVSLDQSGLMTIPVITAFGFTLAMCWMASTLNQTYNALRPQHGG